MKPNIGPARIGQH